MTLLEIDSLQNLFKLRLLRGLSWIIRETLDAVTSDSMRDTEGAQRKREEGHSMETDEPGGWGWPLAGESREPGEATRRMTLCSNPQQEHSPASRHLDFQL